MCLRDALVPFLWTFLPLGIGEMHKFGSDKFDAIWTLQHEAGQANQTYCNFGLQSR